MDDTTRPIGLTGNVVEHVPARAALAGNPSDGYAGAVFAIPVEAYQATVTVRSAAAWSVSDNMSGRRSFNDYDELRQATNAVAADQPHALMLASLDWFIEQSERELPPLSIEVTSTIPVSVGLAGSSAIVISVLRALHRATQTELPLIMPLAHIALGVETRRLGITAGLQDRLVQACGRPVLMRFDRSEEYEATPKPGGDDLGSASVTESGAEFRIMVAHRAGLSEPSQVVHGNLRRRYDNGDADVRGAMDELAAHAFGARNAFVAGDAALLGAAMNATYDLRALMIDLAPGHSEMVHAARAAGAAANYTGSGGAVVVLSADEEIEDAARQSLKRLGCEIVSADAEPDPSGPGRSAPD